jgi:hypothetical protein
MTLFKITKGPDGSFYATIKVKNIWAVRHKMIVKGDDYYTEFDIDGLYTIEVWYDCDVNLGWARRTGVEHDGLAWSGYQVDVL